MVPIESKEIVSSTGSLGLERRSYDRLYLNWRFGILSDVSFMERLFRRATESVDHGNASRCVLRALITEDAIRDLSGRPLASALEAAVPVGDINGRLVWMGLFGVNAAFRRPIVSVEEMIGATSVYKLPKVSPLGHIQSLAQRGFSHITHIDPSSYDGVYDLWGRTFEWTQEGISALSRRLAHQQHLHSSQRDVWFSGFLDPEGHVVSVSMAELLGLPTGTGECIPIVESTEWRTREGYKNQGLMTATTWLLHSQIVSDLSGLPRRPLIIAETNFSTRSDFVGNAVGMVIPARSIGETTIPQILVQNVVVGDGIMPEGLRDFTMMYIPPKKWR